MGRRPRIEYYGAIYHITIEGKDDIFKDDEDKITFLEILGELRDRCDFKVLAYCILDNKYDLLIKFHNIFISKVMQRVSMYYTRYFNLKYHRKGSPYKGRYKSTIIEDKKYLLGKIRDIHLIPMRKGYVTSMEDYKWSSDVFYRFNLESTLDIGFILDDLDDDRNLAIKRYIDYMNLGDVKIKDERKIPCELDEILRDVCTNELDFNLIKSGSKKSYLMVFKKEYIKRCRELAFSIKDIGENIGIGERAVRKHLT